MSVAAKISAILEKNKTLSPGDKVHMEKQAEAMLALLNPIHGITLEDREFNGLMVELVEETYRGASLFVGRPTLEPKSIQLAHKEIGRAPGLYEIWVVWDSGQIRVFYTRVDTGNLRKATLDDMADELGV